MNRWTVAKLALGLAGIILVLAGDQLDRHWLGFVGLVPLAGAFLLRFVQRKFDPSRKDSPTPI